MKEITGALDERLAAAKEAREEAAGKARQKAKDEDKKPKQIEEAVKAATKKQDSKVKSLKSAREELDLYGALLDEDLEAAEKLAEKATGEIYTKARLHCTTSRRGAGRRRPAAP